MHALCIILFGQRGLFVASASKLRDAIVIIIVSHHISIAVDTLHPMLDRCHISSPEEFSSFCLESMIRKPWHLKILLYHSNVPEREDYPS